MVNKSAKKPFSISFQLQGTRFGQFLSLIASSAEILTKNKQTDQQKKIIAHIKRHSALSLILSEHLRSRDTTYTWLMGLPYRRKGNLGYGYWNVSSSPASAHAFVASSRHSNISPVGEQTLDQCLQPGKWPRSDKLKIECTEIQILNEFLVKKIDGNGDVGDLVLFTERFPCKSCLSVINNFLQKKNNVSIHLYFEHGKIMRHQHSSAMQITKKNGKRLAISSLMQKT